MLSLAALLGATAACDGGSAGDTDGGSVGADAGPSDDGGAGALAPLRGVWSFEVTPVGEGGTGLQCTVMVQDGGIDAVCPSARWSPIMVGPECLQLRDELHVAAQLDDRGLDGKRDRIVEFQGAGCAAMGHTVGTAYPTSPDALIGGEHRQYAELVLLELIGGSWSFYLDDADGAARLLGCEVEVTMGVSGVQLIAECPRGEAPPTTVEDTPGACVETASDVLTATFDLFALGGELEVVVRREGACDGPAEERVSVAHVSATIQ